MYGNGHDQQARTLHLLPHSVEFYESPENLLVRLADFVTRVLERGSSVVLITTTRRAQGLSLALSSRGFDITMHARQGRYRHIDAVELISRFMVGKMPDWRKFSSEIGHVLAEAATASPMPDGEVEVFGEAVSVLWQEGNPQAALELERYWNLLARSYRFALKCAYPVDSFGAQNAMLYRTVCNQHSAFFFTDVSSDSILKLTRQRLKGLWNRLQEHDIDS